MRLRPFLLPLLGLLLACTAEPPAATPAPSAQVATGEGARPALNEEFRKPDMDVASWVARFEGESREIAAQREAIVALLALKPGESVADIGAGTGLFEEPFAKAVGPTGTVYAVDISPAFLEHLRQRAAESGWKQVRVVACDDRSTKLPAASVDAAFLCDTYHHLEHPGETLGSLLRAMRPGGRLLVVDFHRVPGTSRDWVLEHVRCGAEQVRAEIEAAGFRWLRDVTPAGLSENYALLFEAPAR
jgi:ubiquinone/menaquinone biosynthesis C-methylase UbiE